MKIVREWLQSRLRVTTMMVGIGAVVLYELARAYYRPYIYSHGANDFHIADTLGNSLGTVATVLTLASVFGRNFEKGIFVLRAATISVVIYELLHPLLGKRMDPWDIIATLIAGAVSEVLFRLLGQRLSQNA